MRTRMGRSVSTSGGSSSTRAADRSPACAPSPRPARAPVSVRLHGALVRQRVVQLAHHVDERARAQAPMPSAIHPRSSLRRAPHIYAPLDPPRKRRSVDQRYSPAPSKHLKASDSNRQSPCAASCAQEESAGRGRRSRASSGSTRRRVTSPPARGGRGGRRALAAQHTKRSTRSCSEM